MSALRRRASGSFFASLAAATLATSTSGCLDEPEFVTSYASEVDLCAPEAAGELAARVADCRARWDDDGSCAGIMSFHGTLDLVPGIVSSRELDRTSYVITSRPGGVTLANVALGGRAPFFAYVLSLDDIGGLVDAGDVARTIDLARPPAFGPATLDDERLTMTFLIEDGAASKDRQHRTGAVTISRQTADELVGTFHGMNFGGDDLAGCFHAFVTDTRVE